MPRAHAAQGTTIDASSFLPADSRMLVPCEESLQSFKVGAAVGLQAIVAPAKSCAPLFGHCRARPDLLDPVGYLGDFNDSLIRKVVGVHLDLIYRKGVYAAGVKPDGSTSHATQVWADPKGLDSPACNIACGEINDARGVRKDAPYGRKCGLWGWENNKWYYVGDQKMYINECRGTPGGPEGYNRVSFSDTSNRAINENLDTLMGRSTHTKGNTGPWTGADDDCEGVFTEDFADSTRFSAYQVGTLVQATWFALDEVLTEVNSNERSFKVSAECAALAADSMNDLKEGVAALDELKLCGPTKTLEDGKVVPNDLAHVAGDPDHPERDADRPPTQVESQIRAMVLATKTNHLMRAAECEVYARAHKRFQERTLTPEAMVQDAERVHWSLFEPNRVAEYSYDDDNDSKILEAMWGPPGGAAQVGLRFYNQWINRFWKWMYEPNRGLAGTSAVANPPLQIDGFPSARLPGTTKSGKDRAEITSRTGANIEVVPLSNSASTARELDLNALPPVPTGCQMIDRVAHPNAARIDLSRTRRLASVPWGLRAGAWLIGTLLTTPAHARDEYYHFIKNRCNGMNGILLTNQLARDCCEYDPGDTDRLNPRTKLGAPNCPGTLDDLIAEVHEQAVPPPGGPTGGGGVGGGTVEAAVNALRALASGASVVRASPGPGSMNGGVYAQNLGAGLGSTSEFSKTTGGTGAGGSGRGSGPENGKKSGPGGGSASGGTGGAGAGFGSLSTAPSVDPDAEAKRQAALAALAASGDASSTYVANRGAGGGSGGSGNPENTVDRVEWNIPGQGGADAGALAESAETEDPSNYFDRLGPNDSLFKKVSDRYRKKRPQFASP